MLNIRQAQKEDLEKYLYWANDPLVREWSYNPNAIRLSDHTAWFERKLQDPDCHLYVFQKEQGECIGQVRIEIEPDHEAVIGISSMPASGARDMACRCWNRPWLLFAKHIPKSASMRILRPRTKVLKCSLKRPILV
jgi:hypothetical protein